MAYYTFKQHGVLDFIQLAWLLIRLGTTILRRKASMRSRSIPTILMR